MKSIETIKKDETTGMKLLRIEQVAELLPVKVSTLYSWVHCRKIPYIKLNGILCFDYDDLKEFAMKNKIA